MEASRGILAGHPLNQACVKEGHPAITQVWLWGQGRAPAMPTLIVAGALAVEGEFSLPAVFGLAFVACMLGDAVPRCMNSIEVETIVAAVGAALGASSASACAPLRQRVLDQVDGDGVEVGARAQPLDDPFEQQTPHEG